MTSLSQISQKDKRALTILLTALVIFAFIHFAFSPLIAQRKQLAKKIESKNSGLSKMRAMQNKINQLSLKSNSLEQLVAARPADFSLYAFLEEKCAEAQVKKNISYMKPSESSGDGAIQQVMVKMKLKAIHLNLLVAFLERVESAEHVVALNRIQVDVNEKDRGTLDVIMQVISLVQTEMISD